VAHHACDTIVTSGLLIARWRIDRLLHRLLEGERSGALPSWKLLKTLQILANDRLSRNKHENMFDEPFHIINRRDFRSFEWVCAQIESDRAVGICRMG
jgi:hypothetical protein